MRGWATVTLGIALIGAAAGVGYTMGRAQGAPSPVALVPGVPPHEVPAWREALDAARATAGAETHRARVLEVVNAADGSVALAEAVRQLGFVAQPDDHDLLLSMVHSGDAALVPAGLEALGRLGTDEAVDTLVTALDDRHLDTAVVLAALGHTGHPVAFDVLEARLAHPEHAWVAAWSLAHFATPRAVHVLARALREADPLRAGALARALASLVDDVPEASQALHSVLSGPRTPRRSAALAALAEAHDPLVYDLFLADLDGAAPTAAQAAMGLGTLGDPRAVPRLADLARNGQGEVRAAAIEGLARLDHREADDALLRLVAEAPPTVAARAVHALPRIDTPEVLDALLAAVAERPTDVRRAALQRLLGGTWATGEIPEAVLELARIELTHPSAQAWGVDPVGLLLQHGGPDDVQLVAHALVEGPTPVRTAAVWSLQQLGTPGARELLVRLADDPDPSVRQGALSALLELGDEAEVERRILDHLERGLQNYGAAEDLLVRIGTPRAIDAVFQRVEQGTQREWTSAVSALAVSGSRDHSERLLAIAEATDDAALRNHILQSLTWSETVDLQRVVDRALASDAPQLHATAAHGLARMGTPEARDRLVAMVDSPHDSVATAAIGSLGQVGGPEAEAALVGALQEPDLAWAAVASLQQAGTPTARDALLSAATSAEAPAVRASIVQQLPWLGAGDADVRLDEALDDEAPEVRQAAIGALQGLGTTQAAEVLASALVHGGLDDAEAVAAARALDQLGGEVAAAHRDAIDALLPQGTLDTGTGTFLPD